MAYDHGLGPERLDGTDSVDPLAAQCGRQRLGEEGVRPVVDDVARDGQFEIGDPKESAGVRVRVAGVDCVQSVAIELNGGVLWIEGFGGWRGREANLVSGEPGGPKLTQGWR